MDLYTTLARKPSQFLACTGMPLPLFEQRLPQFETAHRAIEEQRKQVTVRTRRPRQQNLME